MTDLKQTLGTWQLLAFGVAGVVGASWIYTNSAFFDLYGAGGVLIGLAIGVALAACIASAYSRFTAVFPRAGGEVVFAYATLGRGASFLTGWMLLGAYVSSLAFYVTAFGYLLGNFFPWMNTIPLYTINDETVYLPVLAVGVVLTLVYFTLNWFSVKIGAQVQLLMFLAIIAGGLALAVTGFAAGSPGNLVPAFGPEAAPFADTMRFVIPGMTFLAGFGLVAVLAEDARIAPAKTGRLVVLTVLLAGGFYLLVLLATAWVLPWQEVAAMDLGTVDAFRAAGFPALGAVAYLIAVLGLLTSFLGLFVACSRVMVAMGRAGLLPSALAAVHPRRGTPHIALVFVTVITLALGWLGPGAVTWFLDTGGIYLGVVWIAVTLAYYRAPRRYPQVRGATPWWENALPGIGAAGALFVIVLALLPGTGSSLVWPAEYIILLAWLALGFVLYLGGARKPDAEALQSLTGSTAAGADRRGGHEG